MVSGSVVSYKYTRQTNSFIENSIEAGILLGGNGVLHAMAYKYTTPLSTESVKSTLSSFGRAAAPSKVMGILVAEHSSTEYGVCEPSEGQSAPSMTE